MVDLLFYLGENPSQTLNQDCLMEEPWAEGAEIAGSNLRRIQKQKRDSLTVKQHAPAEHRFVKSTTSPQIT